MLMQELPLTRYSPHRARRLAAAMLRSASRMLDSLAAALIVERPGRDSEDTVEFHAEAGAPEGALYVNGEWVGNLLGVTRL